MWSKGAIIEFVGSIFACIAFLLPLAGLAEDTWTLVREKNDSFGLPDMEFGVYEVRSDGSSISYEDCESLNLDHCHSLKNAGMWTLAAFVLTVLIAGFGIALLLIATFTNYIRHTKPAFIALISAILPAFIGLLIWKNDGHDEIEYIAEAQEKVYGRSFNLGVSTLFFLSASVFLLRLGPRYKQVKYGFDPVP